MRQPAPPSLRGPSALPALATAALAAGLAAPAAGATMADLAIDVVTELESSCATGTRIQVESDALVLNPDATVTVRMAGFTCPWRQGGHPYCNDQACEVRLYRWTGVRFELLGARLE